jgi:cellulose synthase/poly-beta-1,6-N-acetylglucosamine synthase-like glycosyltransferase
MNYPPSRFRILVLDDGTSEALREAVHELHTAKTTAPTAYPEIQYHRRGTKSDHHVFAKAGNLNHAIFDIQEAQEFSAPEFIVVFDADSIPSPHFLRATLPHLLRHPDLGMVGTLQRFYNLPPGDPLSQALDGYSEIFIPRMNQLGAGFTSGSGILIRRGLLIEVGGFPTISFSEDFTLCFILHGLGRQFIVLAESLQWGLVPTSLEGHVAQRQRWFIGLSQLVGSLKRSPDNTIPPHMRWSAVIQGVICICEVLGPALAFVVMPLALSSGQQLVPGMSSIHLKVQVVLAISHVSCTWLHEWLQSLQTGFRVSPFTALFDFWLAPGKRAGPLSILC